MISIGYLSLSQGQLAAGVSEPHNVLIASGVQRLFIDVELGQGHQPQLECAIETLSAGDVLVTPSLDTLTRSIPGLLRIHARLDAAGASLRVLSLAGGLQLDTSLVEGRAILGALAVMSAMPEQRPVLPQAGKTVADGLPAAASVEDPSALSSRAYLEFLSRLPPARRRGRPATACSQSTEVNRLRAQGLRAVEIAACLGIGRASVYRILSQGQVDGGFSGAMSEAEDTTA